MAALRLPPSDVRITADGAILEARSPLVLIANGGSAIAPNFRIYPGIAVDDGWLDVLVFTSSTPAEIAATLGYAGRQQLDRSPHVMHRRARSCGDRGDASPSRRVGRRPARNDASAVQHRPAGFACDAYRVMGFRNCGATAAFVKQLARLRVSECVN